MLKWHIFSKARVVLDEQMELFSIDLVWQGCMATLKILIGQKYAASSRFFCFDQITMLVLSTNDDGGD